MNQHTTKFFNSDEVYISSRMNEYLKNNFGYEISGDLASLREAKASLEVTKMELKDEYMSAKYVENMLMIETIKSLLKAHGPDSNTSIIKEDSDPVEEELNEFTISDIKQMIKKGLIAEPTDIHWQKLKKINHENNGNITKDDLTNVGVIRGPHPFEEEKKIMASEELELGDTAEDMAKGLSMSMDEFWELAESVGIDQYGGLTKDNYEDVMNHIADNADRYLKEETDEEKGPEHYRYVNDSQLSRVQDRLRLTISDLDHAIQYRAKNSHLFFNTGDKAGTGDLYGIKEKLEKIDDEWDDQTELYGM